MVAKPLVSVTLLAYNHGKYIEQAIQSVLKQTFSDLEIVVVNDGSTDNTAEILNRQTDPRVRVFHQTNQGPSMAANRALSECRGKYLAIMAGDDMIPPQRIERQLHEYEKGGTRLLFSQVEFINEEGEPTDTDYYASNLTPARGRAQVLRRFFEGKTPAFILTLFTEARLLKAERQYCEPSLYQLQDNELMVRLAKKYDFDYLDEKLYQFRLRRGHTNLSGPDPGKLVRTRNEFYLIMRRFFEDIPIELFKEIFADLVRNPNFHTPIEYQCEQGFVLLRAPTSSVRLLGAERLYELLRQPEARSVLANKYGFTHVTFSESLKCLDTEHLYEQTSLYMDTGAGFNETEKAWIPVNIKVEPFELRFDLSKSPPLRALRWDPVESCYCQVYLDSAAWEDSQGKIIPIDVKKLASNGVPRQDGSILFGTSDPMLFLPVEENVTALTLRGRWRFDVYKKIERFRTSRLYLDDGSSYRVERSVEQKVFLDDSAFELTFDTSSYGPVRMLRWDPVQGGFCKIQLYDVHYRDSEGMRHSLNPHKIASNGALLADGAYLFDTSDPMFFLPVEGALASVTIRGHWWGPLTPMEAQYLKLLDPIGGPSWWVRRFVKGSVQKLRKYRMRNQAA